MESSLIYIYKKKSEVKVRASIVATSKPTYNFGRWLFYPGLVPYGLARVPSQRLETQNDLEKAMDVAYRKTFLKNLIHFGLSQRLLVAIQCYLER